MLLALLGVGDDKVFKSMIYYVNRMKCLTNDAKMNFQIVESSFNLLVINANRTLAQGYHRKTQATALGIAPGNKNGVHHRRPISPPFRYYLFKTKTDLIACPASENYLSDHQSPDHYVLAQNLLFGILNRLETLCPYAPR